MALPRDHIRHMKRAIELAERGRGRVHPNPLVGAVLACADTSIAEGWHTACGHPHAEIEAIRAARAVGFTGWSEATLYVTLEPCCHHGRTPPCADAIIDAGIRRVVFALDDPDPRVAGGGRARLEAAGIAVEKGILGEEAAAQNEAYLHHRRTGLPFVTWKTVRTPDGATSWVPGTRTAVSCAETNAWVDELRGHHDAILVGGRTARTDDPGLRIRHRPRADGGPESLTTPDPWRIVLTASGSIPLSAKLLTENDDKRTMILTGTVAGRDSSPRARASMDVLSGAGAEVRTVTASEAGLDLREALRLLADRGLLAILAEAGDTLGRALLAAGLLRRLIVIEAPASSAPAGWERAVHPPSHADLVSLPGLCREDRIGRDRRIVIDLGLSPGGKRS